MNTLNIKVYKQHPYLTPFNIFHPVFLPLLRMLAKFDWYFTFVYLRLLNSYKNRLTCLKQKQNLFLFVYYFQWNVWWLGDEIEGAVLFLSVFLIESDCYSETDIILSCLQ